MQLQWKICTSVDQIEQWSQEMFWKIVHLKILKNASIMVLICKIFWGRKRVNNRKRFWVALIANCNWLSGKELRFYGVFWISQARCKRGYRIHPFVCITLFFWPLKTLENCKVFWFFQGVGKVCSYDRWVLSEGHKNYFKNWCLMNSQPTFLFLNYLNLMNHDHIIKI